jgi:hypothetical protein
MIQEFYDNHLFLYIMGGLCGVGVFLKFFLLIIYNKLIKASECMTNTNKNWLKNMRLRFESSYHLQLGVNDVDIYVDKYVSKIKYGGLLLSTWENLSGQTIGLCLLTGSFAGILGFVYECGQGPVLFTFFAGAWTAIIVNIVDNIVNISAHKQMLRFNLIDYFENNLKVRMEHELYHTDARRKYQRQYFDNVDNTECKDNFTMNVEISEIDSDIRINQEPARVEKKQSRKEIKTNKKQAKSEEKNAKKQVKHEKMVAAKKEKKDGKQARLDAVQERKKAKLDKKQQKVEEVNAKRKVREENMIAKEKAIIEAMLAKKNAKEVEREEKDKRRELILQERERLEKERRQKELENNKAYKEKMRLKQEKEREAAKKKEELQILEAAKEQERKQKEEVAMSDRLELESEEKEFKEMRDADSIAMAATSQEENMLIEEVLKDFLF